MKQPPARKITWKGTVSNQGASAAVLADSGDVVVVDRGRPRWLVMRCPCGCGEDLPINLDERAGPAWSMYRTRGRLSLFPSVWRESGCGSHFIVWRDELLLFGHHHDDDAFEPAGEDEAGSLMDATLERLPRDTLVYFSDLARDLDVVPWDVLKACRALVRRGLAKEGANKARGRFGRL